MTKYDLRTNVLVDGIDKSGLNVYVNIKRTNDNKYYNGSTWQVDKIGLLMTDNADGSYTLDFDDIVDTTNSNSYAITYYCNDTDYEFSASETFTRPKTIVGLEATGIKKSRDIIAVVERWCYDGEE